MSNKNNILEINSKNITYVAGVYVGKLYIYMKKRNTGFRFCQNKRPEGI